MRYEIGFDPGARREFARLPEAARKAVRNALDCLSDDPRPHGVKKMADLDAYRIRVGVYRVVYAIEDDRLVVLVVQVGHRKDVYRALDVIRKRLKG
jgi:mRNA interferase RelE/StbE